MSVNKDVAFLDNLTVAFNTEIDRFNIIFNTVMDRLEKTIKERDSLNKRVAQIEEELKISESDSKYRKKYKDLKQQILESFYDDDDDDDDDEDDE